jgi:hypothetical protein
MGLPVALAAAGLACAGPDPSVEMPEALEQPGLRKWEGQRESWTILEAPSVGVVTDIVVGPRGGGGDEVLLVGTRGAYRTRPYPRRPERVDFEVSPDGAAYWRVEALDLDGDGIREFVSRGGNWRPPAVLGRDGAVRWRHEWGASQMASGNLDGDGRTDLVVGMNGDGGLSRLGVRGRTRWEVPARNVWHVELHDLDGDGRDEILHTGCCSGIEVRDASGRRVRTVQLGVGATGFSVTGWPDQVPGIKLAYPLHERLWISDLDGKTLRSLPLGVTAGPVPARLAGFFPEPGGPAGLAVLLDHRRVGRSVLNLYDPEGRLFYHEVLPWSCASLTVDARDPEAEVLLLGCDGRLVGNGPFAALHRRALALVEHAQGPGSVSLLPELRALAWALLGSGDPATALLHAQRAVEIGIASLPPDHPDRAANLNTLGFVELELGEVDAALADLGAALELLRDRDSRNPRLLSDLHFNLGAAWRRRGELGPAETHYRRSLELVPAERGGESPDAAKAAYGLARVLLEQGRHAEAEAMVKRALDNDRAAFSPAHPEVARDLQLYGEILRAAGREEDALALEGQADMILTGPPASGAS